MRITTIVAPSASGPAIPTEEESSRRGSRLACNHFRNIANDVGLGILTDEELRDKLKEVNSDDNIATPEVQSAATDMLATAGDDSGLAAAVGAMDDACGESGN